jgi:hypothetical protein
MPISFEEAKTIAQARIPKEGVLVNIIPKSYGWYFLCQSQAFVETGNILEAWIGSGGFIVEKADGRVFEFGSAYSLEENFRRYEMGFKYEFYDLIISEVINLNLAIDYLYRLDMTFVIPEEAHRNPAFFQNRYTKSQIRQKLKTLPCVFSKQRFYFRIDVIEEMERAKCLVFSVVEHNSAT